MVNARFPAYLSNDCHLFGIVVDDWRAVVQEKPRWTGNQSIKKKISQYFISKIGKRLLRSSLSKNPSSIFRRKRIYLNWRIYRKPDIVVDNTKLSIHLSYLLVPCHNVKYCFIILPAMCKLWHCDKHKRLAASTHTYNTLLFIAPFSLLSMRSMTFNIIFFFSAQVSIFFMWFLILFCRFMQCDG